MINNARYRSIRINPVDSFNRFSVVIELLHRMRAIKPTVARVGEVDSSLFVEDEIIGRVVALSFVSICQHGDRSIGFCSRHAPVSALAMAFASVESAFTVECQAIRLS